jgi:hypothetical protein
VITGTVTPDNDRPAPLDRYVSTASIIAAVRLAKVADLDMNMTKVMSTVQQAVRLARTILDETMRR